MLFTRIPQQYAPLGGELRYAVEQTAAGNIDIRIAAADGTLLGAKRFAAVTTAAAEAAEEIPEKTDENGKKNLSEAKTMKKQ